MLCKLSFVHLTHVHKKVTAKPPHLLKGRGCWLKEKRSGVSAPADRADSVPRLASIAGLLYRELETVFTIGFLCSDKPPVGTDLHSS